MPDIPPRLVAALADRYTLERELGQGGMATVYLAQDIRHERQVAVKVFRPELAATIGGERFLREIRIAAQLQHPHILPLLDSGDADGFLYYVMPFVDGESLRERLSRQGELPVHEAVRLVAEVVDALSYAHARGVVHRDVKPDNVMLSGRHALVMDFGVAKAVSEASGRNTLTTVGVALGTPAYMAPEQAAADPHLDHRVDIYAVGVMAYELLGGRPPFTGGTPQQVLAAQVTQAPDALSKHRPGISAALEETVMRCLAKRPADRWQTADELLAQLEPLVTPSGGMTPTSTRPISAWQPASRRRGYLVAGTVAALAVAAFLWARGAPGVRAPAAPVRLLEPDRTQLTFTGNTDVPSLSPDGQRLAYSTRRCADDGRCVLDMVVQDVGGAGSATIVRAAQALWAIDWSADGRYLVFSGSFGPTNWGAFSVPALGGEPRRLGCCVARTTFAGDTALVVGFTGADSVAWMRVVTFSDGVVHDSVALPRSSAGDPDIQPLADGKVVMLTDNLLRVLDRHARVLDSMRLSGPGYSGSTATPDRNGILTFFESPRTQGEYTALVRAISPEGRFAPTADTVIRQLSITAPPTTSRSGQMVLGAGALESSVHAFRRAGAADVRFALRPLAVATSLGVTGSVRPDGEVVLLARNFLSGGRRLTQFSLVSTDGGAETKLGNAMDTSDWDWSMDGASIMVMSVRGDTTVVQRLDASTGRVTRVTALAKDFHEIATLPGGGFVVLAGDGRAFRRIGSPGQPDTLFRIPREYGTVSASDPSPDGRAIVAVGWDATDDSVSVLRISTIDGSVTPLVRFAGEGSQQATWLPDGTILVPVLETAWTLGWYRIPAGGGKPVRLGSPPRFPADYRFSRDGLHGIARVSDSRADVYLIRNFADLLKARSAH